MTVWAVMLVYTVVVSYTLGYPREHPRLEQITFTCGVPSWVFWGILVPWAACWLFCYWFSYHFMRDDDLGPEADPSERSGEVPDAG